MNCVIDVKSWIYFQCYSRDGIIPQEPDWLEQNLSEKNSHLDIWLKGKTLDFSIADSQFREFIFIQEFLSKTNVLCLTTAMDTS